MSLLFTIEGLDGTGKSTLASALNEALVKERVNPWIYQTKEPGLETKVGKIPFPRSGIDFRSIVLNDKQLTAMERELLFYVDASQHRRFIENQKDALIISDRGLWSHLAYLRATLKTGQIDYQAYSVCRDVIELTCPKPSRVIYLRGSLELMEQRNAGKTKDVIESNGLDYFGYVLETYEDLAFENESCLILDACNSTSQNIELVINWLKKEFSHEQLRAGNL
jgi:thymidylate kinase